MQVVITRQGCDMSAAVQLSQLLSEQAPSPTAAQDSVVPYNALASRVRSVCAAALLQELIMLGVDAAADEWVLQAFAELPAKEAELAGKQTDLAKVQNRLQTLQQMLQEAQHSSTAAPEEEAQHESQQVQTESVEHSGAAADAAQSAQAQLESTIGLCLQMSGQLESQVAELQALLDHWHGLVQQNKQLAVTYRLQKHALLMHVLEQLNNA
jgi:chromosome segregation ATPase